MGETGRSAKVDGPEIQKWMAQRTETERSFDYKLHDQKGPNKKVSLYENRPLWLKRPSCFAQMNVNFGPRPFIFGWIVHIRTIVHFDPFRPFTLDLTQFIGLNF